MVVAAGTPEQVAGTPGSFTGEFLASMLTAEVSDPQTARAKASRAAAKPGSQEAAKPRSKAARVT